MRSTQSNTIVQLMRGLVAGHGDEQASDRDLLRRFVKERDEDAFTALVRRHGGMVMGVGLRLLHHRQDAEDVCQATFLLLARKASATAWRDSVANWLYGVAYRLALKCRAAAKRRQARDGKARPRSAPDPLADISVRDLQRVLDEELNRLAAKYRAPLILCCLEGKTRDEAARYLGQSLTTLGGRLEAGREVLRRRLARRGVAFSLALAGATLSAATVDAAVPAVVVQATRQAALRIVAGESACQVVSGNVASLVKGGLQAMFLTKLTCGAACALLLAMLSIVAWCAAPNSSAQEPPPPAAGARQEKAAAQKQPPSRGAGTLLLARQGGFLTLTPDGKERTELGAPKDTRPNFTGRLSPDGTRVAYTVTEDGPPRPPARAGEEPEPWPFKIVVRKLGEAEPSAVVDMPAHQLYLIWAADGKRLLVTKQTGARPETNLETVLLNPKTGKTEPVALPDGARVLDSSRNGNTLLVVQRHEKKYRLGLAGPGDTGVRVLTDLKGWTGDHAGRLSPDGTKVLYTDADPADNDANKWGVSSKPYILDVTTKKREALADFPLNARAVGLTWSPDGKRIAYTWVQLHADLLKKDTLNVNEIGIPTEAFLIIADADGRNARTVCSARGDNAINMILGSIDWR